MSNCLPWGLTKRLHLSLILAFLVFAVPPFAEANDGINLTKHNLSVSGPGNIKALTETRICIFCHTPHNATPQTPLWNKSLKPITYILYTSSTMSANPSQPTGPSRLCLSCHDGTLAIGDVWQPVGGISVTGQITAGKTSFLGIVLSGDHPVSFSYYDSVASPLAGLSPTPPHDLVFYGTGFNMECSTCHDPHTDPYQSPETNGQLTGMFLVMNNQSSALCLQCHNNMNGWNMTTHQSSVSNVNGQLPIAPRLWPTWLTVAQWACEECHTPHLAKGTQRLLYFLQEENNCYTCHNGTVAVKNIYVQMQKFSHHPVEATTGVHDPNEAITGAATHVECVDCHNPHATNGRTAVAPNISGRLDQVKGFTMDRSVINPAIYEYQVCLKCHANITQLVPFIPRVINNTNLQAVFSSANPSYHPVTSIGKSTSVPSIPSSTEPAMTVSSIIYCSDCHKDDNGVTNGPHGSSFPPILGYQYLTTDNTPESATNYALCYYCHNRTSILNNQSFSQHNLHVVGQNAPCSICHDAHGIVDNLMSGSHTHLINFDTRSVSPVAPNTVPIYTDTGNFSGSCTLICHGQTHVNVTYSQASAQSLKPKRPASGPLVNGPNLRRR